MFPHLTMRMMKNNSSNNSMYWRFLAGDVTWEVSYPYYWNIFTLTIYTGFNLTGTDVTLSATATASTSVPGYGPELAIDGNDGTRWASSYNNGIGYQWISLKMPSNTIIRSFRMTGYPYPSALTPRVIYVQTSPNQTTWTTIKTLNTSNTVDQNFNIV